MAQKAWEKPPTDWKYEDCLKILNGSPWAFSFSDLGVEMDSKQLNEKLLFGKVAPQIVLRAYSSDVVRLALVRMNQLANKYDTLSEADRSQVDQRNEKLSNCDLCKKYYVFIMVQPASSDARETLAGKRMMDLKFEELKPYIYLTNDKKEKRELAQYVAPSGLNGFAIFYFERLDAKQTPLSHRTRKNLRAFSERDR